MNVVVDVGNTRVKYAFFEKSELLFLGCGWENLEKEIEILKEQRKVVHLLLAGSGDIPEQYIILLRKLVDFFYETSPTMFLPLKITYLTPETLGFDRIANCIGALKLFPGHPLLVIDSGTCITYNYVSADGIFYGGNISPGIEMRFKSLHHYTAKLPCLTPTENYGNVGKTTNEAILNGVMLGTLFEVKNYITQFQEKEKNAMVVITGGNAHFWKSKFGEEVFFSKDLGLIGLNEVLKSMKKDC